MSDVVRREELLVDLPAKHPHPAEDREADIVVATGCGKKVASEMRGRSEAPCALCFIYRYRSML